MPDLSILIPSRNEMFLARTIQDILEHIEGDTEIIAVLDGAWADPPIQDNPRVTLLHHAVSIGQRAATNEAARVSTAKYIMKCDAHCAFDQGFDVKLMETFEPNWTVVPRMYNLHVFDWKCVACGNQTYQGGKPTKCAKCESTGDFEMVMVWKPRFNRRSDFARFDKELHFQYWGGYEKRPEAKGDIADLMCFVGACWMMQRDHYWDLGGVDEAHGSWGQMGVEISCKSWLSGGRQVVNKKTWFSHLFRTQPGFGFPYHLSTADVEKARARSRWLWEGGNWPKAIHPLSWLIEKFAPVPDWDTSAQVAAVKPLKVGLVYYTDNRLDDKISAAVRAQLNRCRNGYQLVTVSLKPIDLGQNIVLELERSALTMFKQILAGLEACEADVVFFVEHDVLYHNSHFEFRPQRKDIYYYNENVFKVDSTTGHALFYYVQQTSGLCAYRELLLQHYRARIERVEREGFTRAMGFEPGTHRSPRGIDNYGAESWMSLFPNIDIRHSKNMTRNRWRKDQFRNQKFTRGWTEAEEVPGWGRTQGRFKEFLEEVEHGLPESDKVGR